MKTRNARKSHFWFVAICSAAVILGGCLAFTRLWFLAGPWGFFVHYVLGWR